MGINSDINSVSTFYFQVEEEEYARSFPCSPAKRNHATAAFGDADSSTVLVE